MLEDQVEIFTEESDAVNGFEGEQEQMLNADFRNIQTILDFPEQEWEVGFNSPEFSIYLKKNLPTSVFMIKCYSQLPGISKELAFTAMSDMKIRKKWDDILSDVTIIEEDQKKDTLTFRYTIPTPAFIMTREAVVQRQTLKDFPVKGAWTVHHKSVQHPDYPLLPKKYLRVEVKVNAMVFEDDEAIDGCRLSWVIENEIQGNLPRVILNQRAMKNPKIMIEALARACHKIKAGIF